MTTQSGIPVWGLVVVLATILVGSCKLFGPDLVAAHDDAIINCGRNIKITAVTKLGEGIQSSNGLLDEHYDRNSDGMIDIHALSSITGATDEDGFTPHREHPIIWQVDLDFDGLIDVAYIDIHGEGVCTDIVPYLDYNAPLPEQQFRDDDLIVPRPLDEEYDVLPKGGHL